MSLRAALHERRSSQRPLGRRWTLVLAVLVCVAVMAEGPVAYATDQAIPDLVEQHLASREDALSRQHRAAHALARQHAWLAYRLGRRRDLGFFANPTRRRDDARAADQAIAVLRRSLDESKKIAHELERVHDERVNLVARVADDDGPSADTKIPTDVAGGHDEAPVRFRWPLRGTVVVPQGIRTDSVTGVRLRETGVQLLSRMDTLVRAPAPGHVHRVTRHGEGGYEVVVAHGGGYTTIISGLRQVKVAPGDQVLEGDPLGLVGRTLDAAPVVRVALWKAAAPLDPVTVFTL